MVSECKQEVVVGGVILTMSLVMWFDWMPPVAEVKIGAQNGYSVLSFLYFSIC